MFAYLFRIQAPDLGNTKPIKKARDFKNDIEYCQACNKFLAKAAFNISAGSGSMSQVKINIISASTSIV